MLLPKRFIFFSWFGTRCRVDARPEPGSERTRAFEALPGALFPAGARRVDSVLTGSSVSVPVGHGALLLGSWQGIYLWAHRTQPHGREIVVTVLG